MTNLDSIFKSRDITLPTKVCLVIHVCLYFISPTGHSLKTLDLLTMKSLDSKVRLEKNQWLGFRI